MTPDNIITLLEPVLSRVRRIDHWLTPRGGSHSHRTGKLSDGLLVGHVKSLHKVGACPIERGASTTTLALLDLDSHKGGTPWTEMTRVARGLVGAALLLHGIRFIPFRSSGGKGIHLIAIWPLGQPQDARSVRAALADVLAACHLRNAAGGGGVAKGEVEIFPKQDSVPVDGWGTMVILPMTGESEPLDPTTMAAIDLSIVEWPDSDPVPKVAPMQYQVVTVGDKPELAKVRSALFAIDPNTLDYGGSAGSIGWIEVLFATHAATDGSADGLGLFLEWSSQWTGFDAQASHDHTVTNWNAARLKAGGIGAGTLFKKAIEGGWVDPSSVPNIDGLEVVTGPPSVLASTSEGAVFQITSHVAPGSGVPGIISQVEPKVREMSEGRLAYDAFRDELICRNAGGGDWRGFTDEDLTDVRILLEHVGISAAGVENTRAAVHRAARSNSIDSAQQWLLGLPMWDGEERVERFLPAYLGTPDNDYTRAVSRYLLTAIVGRVMEPGCQADMVPVLVGGQGVGKTRSVMALAPTSYYAEIDMGKRDEDQARLMRGKVIGEIAELRGLSSRDSESIKAWLTRTHEEWTPKYRENNTVYARRIVFVGTTNRTEFLTDDTGNRRWLPVNVGLCHPARVKEDRDQLLAEALVRWAADGIDYKAASVLSADAHDEHRETDSWEEPIGNYLAERGNAMFTMSDLLAGALQMPDREISRSIEMRVSRVLQGYGCSKVKFYRNGKQLRGWSSRSIIADGLL